MYTQLDEEHYILNSYEQLVNGSVELTGNILDIGSNDGETISNTRALLLKYPHLICYFVEPNPHAFKKLESMYSKSHHKLFNYAIGEVNGSATLYCNSHHLSEKDTGLLSTIIESELDRWGENETWQQIKVDVLKYPFSQIDFDFISIDTEGMDEKILKQINLTKTKILCIEWNSIAEVKSTIAEYCSQFGLKLIHENSINLIFAR
jgi:FkbM family methyltransferase